MMRGQIVKTNLASMLLTNGWVLRNPIAARKRYYTVIIRTDPLGQDPAGLARLQLSVSQLGF